MTLTGYGIMSRSDTCRSKWAYPCLDGGVFVCQEAQIEMPRAFSIEGEAIRALRRVRSDVVLEEYVCQDDQ